MEIANVSDLLLTFAKTKFLRVAYCPVTSNAQQEDPERCPISHEVLQGQAAQLFEQALILPGGS
jgi:hypothetical protein